MRGVRILPLLAVLWTAALAEEAPVPADLEAILREARRVQFSDMAAWSRFRFHRQVDKHRLGADGEILKAESLEFQISPAEERFDERVVRVDGREPTPAEVREHRREARFSRHYETALSGIGRGDEESGYTLARLLRLASYRYVGQERVGGHLCHRIDFAPSVSGRARGIEARLAEAMEGSLWITAEGYHLARAEARSVKPVSIALSFASVRALDLSMQAMPVGHDVWAPRRIEVRADARISWVPVRRRTIYSYSEFFPLGGETAGVLTPAGH
jgi:hypothetical protein